MTAYTKSNSIHMFILKETPRLPGVTPCTNPTDQQQSEISRLNGKQTRTVGTQKSNRLVRNTADLYIALSLLVVAVNVDISVWNTICHSKVPRSVRTLPRKPNYCKSGCIAHDICVTCSCCCMACICCCCICKNCITCWLAFDVCSLTSCNSFDLLDNSPNVFCE
jgi:hypothetical protein